jgi:hypothetical protein
MHSSKSPWNPSKQKEAVTGSVSTIIGCREGGAKPKPEGGSPGCRAPKNPATTSDAQPHSS